MKRLLALLALAMLLAGCHQTEPPRQTEDATEEPEARQLYAAHSSVELQTNGAVRAYPIGKAGGRKLLRQGNRLLLVCTDGSVISLSGENGTVTAEAVLKGEPDTIQCGDNRIGFFNASENSLIFWDAGLQKTSETVLPEEIVGNPVLSEDLRTVYYCTGSQIRKLDLATGVSRLLKEQNYPGQRLLGLCTEDLLICQVTEADGDQYAAFISTKTGQTRAADDSLLEWTSAGDGYFLRRMEGSLTENLFGTTEKGPYALYPAEPESDCFWLADSGSVLSAWETEEKVHLETYDLSGGKRTAAVEISGIGQVHGAVSDGVFVWFLAGDGETDTLYRWNPAMSGCGDAEVYTSQRYTAQAPDLQGLAQCASWAQALSDRYGVEVTLDAAEMTAPEQGSLTGEYQVRALQNGLEALEAALGQFPEDFFLPLGMRTSGGRLHIYLVRETAGAAEGLQYWFQGDAYIALPIGKNTQKNFFHQVCHVLDSFVIANSSLLDRWEDCNPRGFSYDYNYEDYLKNDSEDYLEEENRAFIDSYSMSYPKEDRARILEYALLPGNEAFFSSDTMQEKLRLLCRAIRDAYGWKARAEIFPWEQYLQMPLESMPS